MKAITIMFVIILSAWAPSAKATLMLDIENGILMGANNVDVDNVLYDVKFVDNTCAFAHGTCTDNSFVFQTQITAGEASNALLQQVLVNTSEGQFGSNIALINGISDPNLNTILTAIEVLDVGFPNERGFMSGIQRYSVNSKTDYKIGSGTLNEHPTTLFGGSNVWAVWSVAASVPEPGTFMLLVLGVAGLSFSRYKKKA